MTFELQPCFGLPLPPSGIICTIDERHSQHSYILCLLVHWQVQPAATTMTSACSRRTDASLNCFTQCFAL